MINMRTEMTQTLAANPVPPWIRLWFVLDAVLFLFPPIYWTTNALKSNVLGMPPNLLYFLSGCGFITCSVVAAYVYDPSRLERGR